MRKPKRHFKVYGQMVICDDTNLSGHDVVIGDWNYFGETWAVSEAAAIRNIKFRRRETGADIFDECHPGGSYDRTTYYKVEEVVNEPN